MTCRMADWGALFERETGATGDGEERLGDGCATSGSGS